MTLSRPIETPWDRWTRRRRHRALVAGLPAVTEAMARELRTGSNVVDAVTAAAADVGGVAGASLERTVAEIGAGGGLLSSLQAWAERESAMGGGDLAPGRFVAVVGLGAELGGALAPALDAGARSLRDRADLDDEIRSLTAQSRASATLMTALPVAACVVLSLIDPALGRFLVSTSGGVACVLLATALDAFGWWWMHWLVRRAS